MDGGRAHSDVQDPPGLVEGLLKGHVTDIAPDALLEDLDVKEVAVLEQSGNAAPGCSFATPLNGLQVDVVGIEDHRKLLVGLGADQGCHEGTRRGAREDSGEELLLIEALDNAKVVEAEGGTPAEQKGGPSEDLAQPREELQLGLQRQLRGVVLGNGLQALAQLLNVFFDEVLGPNKSLRKQLGVPNPTKVPREACSSNKN